MVVTKKGRMARLVAKFRPNVPVSDLDYMEVHCAPLIAFGGLVSAVDVA